MTLRPNQDLDQMLEAVAVAAWDELIQVGTSGLVHIKYRFSVDDSLANLQVWTSETRGHWLLVCEYSGVTSASNNSRVVFSNGYRSELLTSLLNCVIEHQSEFAHPLEGYRDRLVQAQPPTEDDKLRALELVNELQIAYLHLATVLGSAA